MTDRSNWSHHVGDEIGQMVLGPPLLESRRQQQLLIRIAGTEGLAHRRVPMLEVSPIILPSIVFLGQAASALHPVGGRHADAGKPLATGLARLLGLGWLSVSLGLQPGHPPGTARFGLTLQLGNPLLQPFDGSLLLDDQVPLLDDDADQRTLASGPKLNFPIHGTYLT